MTREERDLAGIVVAGSDHLTAYNLYAEAYSRCGYVGEVYGCRGTCSTSESKTGRRGAGFWSKRSRIRLSGWPAYFAR
jgi:hypothetical protein